VALVSRVKDAYKRVPAATITVLGGGGYGVFTEILKGGIVVAEQFKDAALSGTTMLVAPHGSPTYAKEPNTTCWHVLGKSDSQTLTDVGHPLLAFLSSLDGVAVGAPQRTSAGLMLEISQGGVSLELTINDSLLIRRIIATKGKQVISEDFDNLTNPPRLVTPEPRC
jgi:hypothetical protein